MKIVFPCATFIETYFRYISENKWTHALDLCRTVNNESAWACLAVMATQSNSETLDIAVEAYGNISHYEKLLYLQYIKVGKCSK